MSNGVLDKTTKGQQNGNWGTDWDTNDQLGFGTRKQDEATGQMKQNATSSAQETQGVLDQMKNSQSQYVTQSNGDYSKYQGARQGQYGNWKQQSDQLLQQSQDQSKKADAAYSNDILPQLKNNMESAMSLKQSMDPNNSVQTGYRNMFDQQAQNYTNAGAADYGVLAGLGSQATANSMGSGQPMTGGQLQAMQGANMGQAGQAFANAQSYANNLRQQGIMTGIDQSNLAYDRGVQSNNDYQRGLGNYQGTMQGYRGEQGDMGTQRYNMAMQGASQDYNFAQGMDQAQLGFATQQGNQQLAAIGQKYGQQNAILGMEANAAGANNANKVGIMGSMMGVGGSMFGSMMKGGGGGGGGGGGAGAGGSAGSAAGAAAGESGSGDTQNTTIQGPQGNNTSDNTSGQPAQGGDQNAPSGGENYNTGMALTNNQQQPNQNGIYGQMGRNGYQRPAQRPYYYGQSA